MTLPFHHNRHGLAVHGSDQTAEIVRRIGNVTFLFSRDAAVLSFGTDAKHFAEPRAVVRFDGDFGKVNLLSGENGSRGLGHRGIPAGQVAENQTDGECGDGDDDGVFHVCDTVRGLN